MTRKATTKKPEAATKSKAAKAGKKKPAKPKKPRALPAYVVVRELASESPSFSEPERVFASQSDALKFAAERNRDLRQLVNPFCDRSVDYLLKGGEKALLALMKSLGLPMPKKGNGGYSFIDWEVWWDAHYFDMTDAQCAAIWDALDKYNWYTVKTTTVE